MTWIAGPDPAAWERPVSSDPPATPAPPGPAPAGTPTPPPPSSSGSSRSGIAGWLKNLLTVTPEEKARYEARRAERAQARARRAEASAARAAAQKAADDAALQREIEAIRKEAKKSNWRKSWNDKVDLDTRARFAMQGKIAKKKDLVKARQAKRRSDFAGLIAFGVAVDWLNDGFGD